MNITEERILQISNDVSEDCVNATKTELIEVVRYWQQRCDQWSHLHHKRIGEFAVLSAEFISDHLKEPHP